MKKGILLFLLFYSSTHLSIAQDDYVISEPSNSKVSPTDSLLNPDFVSYLLTSSAYTLNKGDFRISSTDIIFAKGSYGLTKNTTGSISISLIGTLVGSIKQQFHINDDLKIGVSASIGQVLSIPTDSTIFFGGGHAIATYGDIQDNISFGSGFYYAKGTFDVLNEEREFLLSNSYIAIQKQIRRRIYLIAEGIYFWNYNVFSGAGGFKVIIKRNMALGFGIMPIAWKDPSINRSNVEAGAIPIISFRIIL